MSFLQPLAFLGFLLFIPVILLYLLKQRRRRVTVSTLLFWEEILRDEHSVASITRLRKILSLLLQLLILLLLIFALSRPILAKDALGARRMVILLDSSASMLTEEGEGTRFSQAQAQVGNIIKGMASGDTAMLVSVGRHSDVVMPFTSSRRTLQEALDGVTVSHGGTDFAQAFHVLTQLPPDERETWVYVVSDGAFDAVPVVPDEKMRFAYLPVGAAVGNVGITAFQVRPLPALPRDFEIMFEVVNATEEEATMPFEIRVGENLVDADEITIPAGGTFHHALRQFSDTGGAVELFVDWDDAFPLDNRAFAVLPDVVSVPVVLVTEGNYFLESALLTDDAITLTSLSPADYEAQQSTLTAPVYIFDGWSPPEAPSGHVIYVGQWPEALGIGVGEALANPIITAWDQSHPVNRHLQLTNISIESAQRITAPARFAALIESFDDPLVILDDGTDRKTMVVGFNTTSSDLPLRVAFPIMIANTIRYMTDNDQTDTWQAPAMGTVLGPETLAEYARGTELIAVLTPGDEAPEQQDGGAEPTEDETPVALAALDVERAGIYQGVTATGELVPLFAANLSDTREVDITVSESLPVTSETPLQQMNNDFRIGAAPWRLIAVASLLVLLLEWGLFHRRWVE